MMKDDNDKETSPIRYSVKLTIAVFIALGTLGLLAALFGDTINMGWIFVPVWTAFLFFILRGIYLMWFK